MKKRTLLLPFFGAAAMALSAQEYTIQTISALKESSITPAFEKKVERTALPSKRLTEGKCNIVTVGEYKTSKEARHDLKKAKKAAHDAFVRPRQRQTPALCSGAPVEVASLKDASAEHPKKEVIEPVMKAAVEEHPAAATGGHDKSVHPAPIATAAVPAVASTTASAPAEAVAAHPEKKPASAPREQPCTAKPCDETHYVYDKNAMRKGDIHEAIEYYKHSPYYSFRPIGLQR